MGILLQAMMVYGVMPLMHSLKQGGGSVWESNPPSGGLAPITGFEVQAAHQHRYASALLFKGL